MAAETFATKLQRELENRQMGVRALARRLNPDNVEQARRSIYKWLAGVEPTEASRDSVTDALDLDRGALDPDEDEEADLAWLMDTPDLASLADTLHALVRQQVNVARRGCLRVGVADDRLVYQLEVLA